MVTILIFSIVLILALLILRFLYVEFLSDTNRIKYKEALKLFNTGQLEQAEVKFLEIRKKLFGLFEKESFYRYSRHYLFYILFLRSRYDADSLLLNLKNIKITTDIEIRLLIKSLLYLKDFNEYNKSFKMKKYDYKYKMKRYEDKLLPIISEFREYQFFDDLVKYYDENDKSDESTFEYGFENNFCSYKKVCWPIHYSIIGTYIALSFEHFISSGGYDISENILESIELQKKILKYAGVLGHYKTITFPTKQYPAHLENLLPYNNTDERINEMISNNAGIKLLIPEQTISTILTSGEYEKRTSCGGYIFASNIAYLQCSVKISSLKQTGNQMKIKIDVRNSRWVDIYIDLPATQYNSLLNGEHPNTRLGKDEFWLPIHVRHSIILIDFQEPFQFNIDTFNEISHLQYSSKLPIIENEIK